MCILHYMHTTVFYLGRFLKKLADGIKKCFSITTGSMYHIKHICQYIFLSWVWIGLKLDGCLMEVSTQYLHFRLKHAHYCLLSWKIPEEISRRSMLFNNWQYVPHQTHMPIHLFIMGVDWSAIEMF